MSGLSRSIPAAGALLALLLLLAAAPTAAGENAERPTVGLVLGGGGARGAAHVGVLQVLEAHRIPVDIIVGTSMGAIVGGLYASGYSAEELQRELLELDWSRVLLGAGERRIRAIRRKNDDQDFYTPFTIGIGLGGFQIPLGIIADHYISQHLSRLTARAEHLEDFDQLPIRFRAVAADIETGEPVLLADGSLARALRASMSIPGILAPAELGGRALVDGALVNNLPVNVARAMGADILIVVDVGHEPLAWEELGSSLAVMQQGINLMVARHSREQLENLGEQDILIHPSLHGYGIEDFRLVEEIARHGRQAAQARQEALTPLQLPAEDYRRWREQIQRTKPPGPVVSRVRIDNDTPLDDHYFRSRLRQRDGRPLDRPMLREDLDRLYGHGYFERVDHRLETAADGKLELVIQPVARSWGPNFLRFGLFLEDDFDGRSHYTAAVGYYRPMINRLGGEWRADLQVGNTPRLSTELWQPLAADSAWFLAPGIALQRQELPLVEDRQISALYRITQVEGKLDLGRELGNRAEIRLGLARGIERVTGRTGAADNGPEDFNTGSLSAALSWDTLDSREFPRQGSGGRLAFERGHSRLGASGDFERLSLSTINAWSRGRHTLLWTNQAGSVLSGEAPPLSQFTLGGFVNLSGYRRNELLDAHLAHTAVVYYRRLGRQERLLGLPLYLGFSAELGNVWPEREDISLDSALAAGSLLLGLNTPVGPVYLAAGLAEPSQHSFYFYLGRTF